MPIWRGQVRNPNSNLATARVKLLTTPNLFVLGFAKCGTTALTDILGAHRHVHIAPIKETYFFLNDHLYAKGTDWYRREFFSGARQSHRWVGEGTPYYANSATSMQRIAEAIDMDNSRFIVALRDPIRRVYSAYWYAHRRGDDPRGFEEAIAQEEAIVARAKAAGEGWWQLAYCDNSMYGRHLETVLKHVHRSRLLVLRDDELRDGTSIKARLATFLDIDVHDFGQTIETSNEASTARSSAIQGLVLGKNPLKRLVQQVLPHNTRAMLRRSILSLNRKKAAYPPMPDEMAAQLRKHFRTDLELAQKLSGVDLSRWLDTNAE